MRSQDIEARTDNLCKEKGKIMEGLLNRKSWEYFRTRGGNREDSWSEARKEMGNIS